tara:strand:- start:5665 stop:5925 length:261 start_codon:yes stop_codon:yes gene_type:complete
MGGMDNKTSTGFAKNKRFAGHHARSFYKGCYSEFLKDPSAQYLMTFSEYKRKWGKSKMEAQKCSAVAEGKRKKENKSGRKKSSRSM